jgi:glycosyltransferase involved in cell wall biosynthesis
MPKLTVAMPTKNGEKYIADAMQSILCEDVDLELVVVDDGSTDRTREIAESFNDPRVRIIEGPQKGCGAANNAGIEAARGEYYASCDHDDQSIPPRFARHIAWLDEHPDVLAICGQCEFMHPSGRHMNFTPNCLEYRDVTEPIRHGRTITHHGGITRRTSFVKRTPWRTFFRYSDDIDHLSRLAFQGSFWMEPHIVYRYRMHTSSLCYQVPVSMLRWYHEVLESCIEERKQTGTDRIDRGDLPEVPEHFPGPPRDVARYVSEAMRHRAARLKSEGRHREARHALFQGILFEPTRPRLYRKWLTSLLLHPFSTR